MATKKSIENKLAVIKEIQADLNDISFKLNLFCQKCADDRTFCNACAIPLTRFKIEHIFIKKIR